MFLSIVRLVLSVSLVVTLAAPASAAAPSQTLLRHPLATNLSDGGSGDLLGEAVAVDGALAAIGAPRDGIGSSVEAGAVYVYEFLAGQWQFRSKLVAPTVQAGAHFGSSVDISGDTLIVGAPDMVVGANATGAGYVFVRTGSTWNLQASLLPSDSANSQSFGAAVSLDGDLAVVGIPLYHLVANQFRGAVEVFTRSAGQWTARERVVYPESDGRFGGAVSVFGDRFAVGAFAHGSVVAPATGRVVVYRKPTPTSLVTEATLAASNAASDDFFGHAVSMSANELAVGAYGRDQGTAANAGAVYLFQRNPDATWSERTMLQASVPLPALSFGWAIDLRPGLLLVGAPGNTTFTANGYGQAFAFTGSGNTWTEAGDLVPAPISVNHRRVGRAVALADVGCLLGAPGSVIGDTGGQGLVVPFLGGPNSWNRQDDLFRLTGVQSAHLGKTVAMSPDGNIVAIGAPDGRRLASDPSHSGVVFVYRYQSQTGWILQATLSSPNAQQFGAFGYALALSNDELVVGAPRESGLVFSAQGFAYVYRFNGSTWALNTALNAPSPTHDMLFGYAVSLDFNQMAVTAPAIGVAGVVAEAHVFRTNAGVWQWLASKSDPSLPVGAGFGISVAIEGTRLAVGIPDKTSGGVLGRGEVAVYTQQNGNWATTTVATYSMFDTSSNAQDAKFGRSLALRYPYLLVGAPGYGNNGAAFGFEASGEFFNGVLDFTPSLGCCDALVGESVAIAGSDLLVGAPGMKVDAGNTPDGAVYVFERGTLFPWELSLEITQTNLGFDVALGHAVAGSHYDYVFGAPNTGGSMIFGNPEEGAVLIQNRELTFVGGFE